MAAALQVEAEHHRVVEQRQHGPDVGGEHIGQSKIEAQSYRNEGSDHFRLAEKKHCRLSRDGCWRGHSRLPHLVSASSLTGSPRARTSEIDDFNTRMRTFSAISRVISLSSSTLWTLPTMPPPVTTVSPRRTFLTSSWWSFSRFCCGRMSRNQNTPMIITSGRIIEMMSPPGVPPAAWAKAGEMNI